MAKKSLLEIASDTAYKQSLVEKSYGALQTNKENSAIKFNKAQLTALALDTKLDDKAFARSLGVDEETGRIIRAQLQREAAAEMAAAARANAAGIAAATRAGQRDRAAPGEAALSGEQLVRDKQDKVAAAAKLYNDTYKLANETKFAPSERLGALKIIDPLGSADPIRLLREQVAHEERIQHAKDIEEARKNLAASAAALQTARDELSAARITLAGEIRSQARSITGKGSGQTTKDSQVPTPGTQPPTAPPPTTKERPVFKP